MNITGTPTNPGELRTPITLQTRAISTQAGGAQVPTWSNLATVWAKWQNVHGSEAFTIQAIQAEQPATVWIRYRAGLDTTCAVLYGGARFEIISIDDVRERHEYQELHVRRMKGG